MTTSRTIIARETTPSSPSDLKTIYQATIDILPLALATVP